MGKLTQSGTSPSNASHSGVNSIAIEEMTQHLRKLVTELMKSNPDIRQIQSLSLKTGIDYSEDPIELMTTVLKRMNTVCTGYRAPKRKPQETSL